jgi:hypothetical protein
VAQLGDGVIALPNDARTREQLEWIAEEITEAAGNATVWLAQPTTVAAEHDLAATMADARAQEYIHVIAAATTAASSPAPERATTARRLRSELRRIQRRDYFPPPERDTARLAVHDLITTATPEPVTPGTNTPVMDAPIKEQS